MTENKKHIKFQAKAIEITANKSGASKFFKGMYFIPTIIAGTLGTVAVIGSSVVSGIGLFGQKSIVERVTNSADSKFDENFNEFKTNLSNKLSDSLKKVTTISTKNVDTIMSDISNTYFNAFKLPLSTATQAAFYQEVTTQAASNTETSSFISSLGTYITTNQTAIQNGAKASATNVVFDLYGEKLTNGEYSKTETWKIVFGVTTAVAGIMVISALGYWISRCVDRKKAKENINIFKKMVAEADDKNVDYVIAKISNRYSVV